MSMWYLGALVPLFPICAALYFRLKDRWENRNALLRRLIKASWEGKERRKRYCMAMCDMKAINAAKIQKKAS